MASAIYLRDDLSVYVVAGVPRSFQKEVAKLVKKATKESGDVKLVNGEMAEWVVSKLKEDSRRSHERTPASAALWRAFRALSAARYHIQDEALEQQVRRIRDEIEELWASLSPLHKEDGSPEAATD
jgi:ribosome-binding ATPase YchF (GTP1/OBG family)